MVFTCVMRSRDLVWMLAGAWICGTAVVVRLAIPEGFILDGKTQHWVPMWIPIALGLSTFSLGLIPFTLQKLRISSPGRSAKSK
jgi:hypothetical protein